MHFILSRNMNGGLLHLALLDPSRAPTNLTLDLNIFYGAAVVIFLLLPSTKSFLASSPSQVPAP
jgi:hypothetical protein